MKVSWKIEEEWLEWYTLPPLERWQQSGKLWEFYLSSGGSLDPEPDSQSPFDPLYAQSKGASDGWSGVHTLRRI